MTYGILLVILLDLLFLRNVSLYDLTLKKCLLCELNLTGTGKISSSIFYANGLVFLGAYGKVLLELNEFSESFILLHNISYSYNRNEVIPIYKVLINLTWEALLTCWQFSTCIDSCRVCRKVVLVEFLIRSQKRDLEISEKWVKR